MKLVAEREEENHLPDPARRTRNVPLIDATEDFCFTVALAANLLVIAGFRADGGLFSVKRICSVNESMLNTKRQYSSPRTASVVPGYRTARTVLSLARD